jgi:hypothetical protein
MRHEGVWGVDVYNKVFFTRLLVGEYSASAPSRFTPGESCSYA